MVKFKEELTKGYICKICGKELKSLGIARHMAMHRDKAEDKQQELNSKEKENDEM